MGTISNNIFYDIMKHIRQINSVNTESYTIVKTDNYTGELEEHFCFERYPETFEISEDELPVYFQYIDFDLN